MMGAFTMPSLGAEMDVGRLVEWRVAPGDHVQRGDIVAVVETDKAEIEVEIYEDGVVEELLVEAGTRVPVGTPLAQVQATPATVGAAAAAAPSAGSGSPSSKPRPEVAGAPPTHPRVRSPIVRALAEELGVDLQRVDGSGSAGEITRHDVERAAGVTGAALHRPPGRRREEPAQRRQASPYARRLAAERGLSLDSLAGSGPNAAVLAGDLPESVARLQPATSPTSADEGGGASSMRRAIARAMERSNREIPHYYLATAVDLDTAMQWLGQRNADRAPRDRLLPAALLLKATALALREYPDLNGFWQDDRHQRSDAVHLGVAVSLRGGGLVSPAIHDADRQELDDVMAALRDLVQRARCGGLKGSEMSSATATVTMLGDLGVEVLLPVIVPPQVAIIGFGRIHDEVVAVDGMVAVRPRVTCTLAADHRVSDGLVGARFLTRIDRLLQEPESL